MHPADEKRPLSKEPLYKSMPPVEDKYDGLITIVVITKEWKFVIR